VFEVVVVLVLNGELRIALDNAIGIHNVDTVWDYGYTGEGISIAIIDTGIDPLHVGLNDFDDDPKTNDPKVVAFYDALDDSGDDGSGETEPYDDQGHGSHCAGISAGTGAVDETPPEMGGDDSKPFRGVAPDAWLVGVKVLDSGGSGSFAEVMRGMEWTIDNKIKYNIRAASMSLGGVWLIELTQEQEERITHLANEMVAAGISLCLSAPGVPIVPYPALFPAAIIKEIPAATISFARWVMRSSCSCVNSINQTPPRDIEAALMLYLILLSIVHSIPLMTSAKLPEPPLSNTLTPTSQASGATPLKGFESSPPISGGVSSTAPVPADIPAQCEPWP
jgi:hypothetical protein